METLPDEIKAIIFMFDPSRKEQFDKTLHQMKFVLPLFQIKKMREVGENWQTDYLERTRENRALWKELFDHHPHFIEIYFHLKWKAFLEDHLKKSAIGIRRG